MKKRKHHIKQNEKYTVFYFILFFPISKQENGLFRCTRLQYAGCDSRTVKAAKRKG